MSHVHSETTSSPSIDLREPEEVRKRVDEFFARMLDLLKDRTSNSSSIGIECQRMGRIFTGEEPGYVSSYWNYAGDQDGHGIAWYLKSEFPGIESHGPRPDQIISNCFGVFAARIFKEAGAAKSADALASTLNDLSRFAVNLLLGLPQTAEEGYGAAWSDAGPEDEPESIATGENYSD